MIVERAYAKLNLALDVVNKREDGYHNLRMIMVPLELHDTLTFLEFDDILLTSDIEIQDNLITKTAWLIKEKYLVKQGVHIRLEKDIPLGAGLAGGSADIAATIRGLNRLWELNLSIEEQEKIALDLGSDTLFCLHNKPAYVSGRGEHITFLNPIHIPTVYLFPSLIEVSTKKVFEHHRIIPSKIAFEDLINAYQCQAFERFFSITYNALTETTLTLYPSLKKEMRILKKIGYPLFMTGSGSTFYALLFNDEDEQLLKKVLKYGINFIKTRTKT